MNLHISPSAARQCDPAIRSAVRSLLIEMRLHQALMAHGDATGREPDIEDHQLSRVMDAVEAVSELMA